MVADDIVTRLRNWVLCETPTEMVMDEAADEIERLRELVVEYKNIATRLIFGAEQQIDELRGVRAPYNKAWLDAWDAYDEAIDRGR